MLEAPKKRVDLWRVSFSIPLLRTVRGTLGGLVALGEPQSLGRHIEQALEQARDEHHRNREEVHLIVSSTLG
jgi:hypothetical protein